LLWHQTHIPGAGWQVAGKKEFGNFPVCCLGIEKNGESGCSKNKGVVGLTLLDYKFIQVIAEKLR